MQVPLNLSGVLEAKSAFGSMDPAAVETLDMSLEQLRERSWLTEVRKWHKGWRCCRASDSGKKKKKVHEKNLEVFYHIEPGVKWSKCGSVKILQGVEEMLCPHGKLYDEKEEASEHCSNYSW